MEGKSRRLTKKDRWFLGILGGILAAAALWFYCFGSGGQGAQAVVTVDGAVYGTYPLAEDRRVEIVIDGVTTNVLEISDGKADMVEADCPDKLCVNQRAISHNHETIICLPNKVVVEIIGGEESELDSIAK